MNEISQTPFSKTRKIIIEILQYEKEFLTTSEIIEKALKKSKDCRDKVPQVLKMLEKEGLVKKRLSKEKKGYTWTFIT